MSKKFDATMYERYRQQIIDAMAKWAKQPLATEHLAEPPPRPKTLMEQWRAGELKPGPHMPMHNINKLPPQKFRCWGCGCCRKLAGFHHCEQCLIGRRPWMPW